MSDAASFDAIMQCNLLEIFCEAMGAALFVTDNRDQVTFASVRLQHLFPIPDEAIKPGKRTRDLYSALFDAGCRLGTADLHKPTINRDEWIAERVAIAWRERVDTIEPCGPGRWLRTVSRRFPSGLGLTIFLDVSEHKKKEHLWRLEQERVRLTEEVLDALPVAVAVKDQNLNYAAVNRQFCEMLGTTADALLGTTLSGMFEDDLMAEFVEKDRELLRTGVDRQSLIEVNHPDGTKNTFLHRARRIGKSGNPYLAMSYEEMPSIGNGVNGINVAASSPSLVLRVGAVGEAISGDLRSTPSSQAKRVVYVYPGEGQPPIAADHNADNVDLCVIRSEAELRAFLPAVIAARLTVDLIVLATDPNEAYSAIAAEYDIALMMLADCDAVAATLPMAKSATNVSDDKTKAIAAAAEIAPPVRPRLEILVVEDNPINQMAVEQIFSSLGLEYVLAPDGADALLRIAERRPALIFADVTLPDLTFDEFTHQLNDFYPQGQTPPALIAMHPKDVEIVPQQSSHVPLADTMTKPLSPDAIDIMIRKHIFGYRNLAATSSKTAA